VLRMCRRRSLESRANGFGSGAVMTYYSQSLVSKANTIIDGFITVTEASHVPETNEIKLGSNDAFLVDATYVYADMADSTTLAHRVKKPVAAKIIRSYVNSATDVLRHYGGEIRSFDGDRVMAIFIGQGKETNAVRAALAANWLVAEHLQGKIAQTWTDVPAFWRLRHGIGVDTGEALITRGGVRADNDLISVGSAPNVAAKLSDVRDGWPLHITDAVYAAMDSEVAFAGPTCMWRRAANQRMGNRSIPVLASTYYWEP
jgi:adenylate cyclase